ncbi:MAG: TonB-dependent receptor [Sphingomonas sp.]|uniref:TonB-dependent receptor n=1 Tax=Sphingomonas sp. TaxID=28214 RepID=UPI0035682F8B
MKTRNMLITRAALLAAAGTAALLAPTAAMARPADPKPRAVSADQATSADQAGQANDKQSLTSADVVVTGSRLAESVPTASLATTQPQSVVDRAYIDKVLSPIADFTKIVAITPGVVLTGTGNGTGLQESKLSIRGFKDGQFGMTYDSIPFNDTNDPTHHSLSFFPSNTVGTVIVDRGPGNASQLGQATFGGDVNLYSRAVTDHMGGQLEAGYGSFNTRLARAELQTGAIDSLGGARFVVAGNYTASDGAMSWEGTLLKNIFAKGVIPIGAHNTLTVLATYTRIRYYQQDNDGTWCGSANGQPLTALTGQNCNPASEIGKYGIDYGLSGPGMPTPADNLAQNYYKFNATNKKTDFEYIRLQSDLGGGFTMDNRLYLYGYTNHTDSGLDGLGQIVDGAGKVVAGTANTVVLTPGGTKQAGIPGYHKLNQYRTWGYIGQLDYNFSRGRVRVGAWYEGSNSNRFTHDIDWVTGQPNYDQKNTSTTSVSNADRAYDQGSSWNQYQLFGEFEFRPLDTLSITPGVKYVHFTRKIAAPVNQKSRNSLYLEHTWTKALPFLTANWKAAHNWSVYFQYAQGFYVPDLSSFYVKDPNLGTALGSLKPMTTTNYQLGTVYHGERFSIDADIYKIDVNNLIVSCDGSTCPKNEQYNAGTIHFKGIEGQFNVLATPGLTLFVNGSINDAIDQSTGTQLKNATRATAGAGALYSGHGLNVSFSNKYTGITYATDYNGDPNRRLYEIHPYWTSDFSINKKFGKHWRVGLSIDNLFDNRAISGIKSDKTGAPKDANGFQSGYGQYDLLYFTPPRQVLADVRFMF